MVRHRWTHREFAWRLMTRKRPRECVAQAYRVADGWMVEVGEERAGPYGEIAVARQSAEARVARQQLAKAMAARFAAWQASPDDAPRS